MEHSTVMIDSRAQKSFGKFSLMIAIEGHRLRSQQEKVLGRIDRTHLSYQQDINLQQRKISVKLFQDLAKNYRLGDHNINV